MVEYERNDLFWDAELKPNDCRRPPCTKNRPCGPTTSLPEYESKHCENPPCGNAVCNARMHVAKAIQQKKTGKGRRICFFRVRAQTWIHWFRSMQCSLAEKFKNGGEVEIRSSYFDEQSSEFLIKSMRYVVETLLTY